MLHDISTEVNTEKVRDTVELLCDAVCVDDGPMVADAHVRPKVTPVMYTRATETTTVADTPVLKDAGTLRTTLIFGRTVTVREYDNGTN